MSCVARPIEVEQFGRAVQIALAERGTQAELAVGVEVARREADQSRRFDHQQIGLRSPASKSSS